MDSDAIYQLLDSVNCWKATLPI